MGAFDKDKEIGSSLHTTIEQREHFVLWAAEVEPNKVSTDLGMADKTTMVVSREADFNKLFIVTSIGGAVATKLKELDEAELPALVFWTRVISKKWGNQAMVLQYVRDYGEGRNTSLQSRAEQMLRAEIATANAA